MKRYKQRFNGMGTMFECETGEWVKHEEADETLNHNADVLFNVIKERNEEIEYLKKTCQEFGDDLEDSRLRGIKLFVLLVISSTLNFITIAIVALTMMGKI